VIKEFAHQLFHQLSGLSSGISGLLGAIPPRYTIGAAISFLIFLLYFSIDIYLFITGRDFGKANIELVIFTRHDFNYKPKHSDGVIFRMIASSISLHQAIGNRYIYTRVILRALKATIEEPVVDFKGYAYRALVPFRDRIAAMFAKGVFVRKEGHPYIEKTFWIVMVDDLTEDKRRYILRVFMIGDSDLRDLEIYLANPPSSTGNNFELYKKVARAFRKDSSNFLKVRVTLPKPSREERKVEAIL
jgi:hypothetical protein